VAARVLIHLLAGLDQGNIANLYQVRGGLLKMARDPADNDLMRREATALTRLQDAVDPALLAYFPPLVATGQRDDARSGIRRHVNLIGALSGFRSLAEVRAAFPAGVDPRDAAWMWRRLLVAIGAAHRAGVIHGAVLPEHVLIHPARARARAGGLVLLGFRAGRPGPGHRAACCGPTGRPPPPSAAIRPRRRRGADRVPGATAAGVAACPGSSWCRG
jgi:Lipopolysaccharide kinase (Kdo/WaaP) family